MQYPKNNINKIISELKNQTKMIAMIAPSFPAEFEYPCIIFQLKELGFNKVTELTFGAKLVNREYHKKLKKSKKLLISSACPGIVETIIHKFPKYKNNLIKTDSPMIATAKICKKHYPNSKTTFISPCDFKKLEAEKSHYVDYVIDYNQLRELLKNCKIKKNNNEMLFDRFYNDYTKIYPLSGGLAKSANLKGILNKNEIFIADGLDKLSKFLENPDPKIKFLDVLFCNGGCIGGPHTNQKIPLPKKTKKIIDYLKKSKKQDIPENRKGLIKKAKRINFNKDIWWTKQQPTKHQKA